jgi:hypothetical protein
VLDGRLDKPFWAIAPWTQDFVDIQGDPMPSPRFRTRAKMLWDDENLYIGAEMEEPQVWSTLTEHDSVIFHDNDFEVFLDPNGDNHLYAELEINALNTTWDLLLVRPYRDGGPAIDGFELHGLRTAVHVDGLLNRPAYVDKGWTVEIAIPFSSLKDIAGCRCPPEIGDQWRINFSRVEWQVRVEQGRIVKVPNTPEDNWVWSPQGVIDMHRPEMWGILQFGQDASDLKAPYPGADDRDVLMRVYYAQQAYRKREGVYSRWLECLGSDGLGLELMSNGSQWLARLGHWTIDHESRISNT